MAKIFCTI